MPEHVHLLVLPTSEESQVSGLLKAIKRPYSYRIKQLLRRKAKEALPVVSRLRPRVPAIGVAGPLTAGRLSSAARLIEKHSRLLSKLTIRQRRDVETLRYWQEGPGDDRNLESPQAIQAAINYIHVNPVRRNLCQRAIEWKWSSARFYLEPEAEVEPDLLRIDGLKSQLFD